MKKSIKIAILIADNRPYWDKEFTLNLLGIIRSFTKWDRTKHKYRLEIATNSNGYDVGEMRETLADEMVIAGADILFWIDSDTCPPINMLERMLTIFEKFEDIEAITGLYTFKVPPFLPHVYSNYDAKEDKFDIAGGFPLKKLFEVQGAGFGCLAIKTKVFKRITKPWFDFDSKKHGEDLYFFRKFFIEKVKPVNIVCDPHLKCRHLRQVGISIDHYIGSNNLKIEKDWIQATPEILKKIGQFHEQNVKH